MIIKINEVYRHLKSEIEPRRSATEIAFFAEMLFLKIETGERVHPAKGIIHMEAPGHELLVSNMIFYILIHRFSVSMSSFSETATCTTTIQRPGREIKCYNVGLAVGFSI